MEIFEKNALQRRFNARNIKIKGWSLSRKKYPKGYTKMNYLYQFSVHSIQSFIYRSNRLVEILAASNIVRSINENLFMEFLRGYGIETDEIIQNAAGNVKIIIQKKDDLDTILRYWPLVASEFAPEIGISQAYVELEAGLTREKSLELRKKLEISRQKIYSNEVPSSPVTLVSRRTGLPVYKQQTINGKIEYLDRGSYYKFQEGAGTSIEKDLGLGIDSSHLTRDISHIATKKSNIALIHIDGNGMGETVLKFNQELLAKNIVGKEFSRAHREFSEKIVQTTREALKTAYEKVLIPAKDKYIPARLILMGGDDLTIIVRADLAIPFTMEYLKSMENSTTLPKPLTASAGIIFMKKNFPFNVGYYFAEELTEHAKQYSRNLDNSIPSSVAFHRISGNLDKIPEWKQKPFINISASPYPIDSKYGEITLDKIYELSQELKKAGTSRGILKEIVYNLQENPQKSRDLWNRYKDVLQKKGIKDTFIKKYTEITGEDIISSSSKGIYEVNYVFDILRLLDVAE